MPYQDQRLDLWVETRLFKKSRRRHSALPGYTKYSNLAFFTIFDMEIPFTLTRTPDLKFQIEAYGHVEESESREGLALAVVRLLFHVVEGTPWLGGSPDAEENS